MCLNRLFGILALLLALSLSGFGQTVPVAPDMLLDIGGWRAYAVSTNLKFDAQGNFYVTGNFDDGITLVDFDPSAAVNTLTSNGKSCFLAKYSAAGALVWAKGFSGEFNGLDIDRNGNITVIGWRAGHGTSRETIYKDAFILHLDNSGNVLWEKVIQSGSKQLTPPSPGSFNLDYQTGYNVTSDHAGNLIAVFTFGGSPDVGGNITAKGNIDGLVVKYDANGNVIWKFNLGSTGYYNNSVLDVLVDKDNSIIITGYTNGTVDYNPLGTPVNVTASTSIFLAKYSPAGILQWVKSINGNMYNYNVALALDGQNNIYINGAFQNSIDFGLGPTLIPTGEQDIFIAKYSPAGNLLYHKNIGGTDATMLNRGMVVGPDNSLYLTGNFNGKVDVDHSSSVAELNTGGAIDMFLAKYDGNGNYQWAFGVPIQITNIAQGDELSLYYNGELLKIGAQYVNVNTNSEIFVTGEFGGIGTIVNFDGTGCGVNNLTAQGNDVFIVRYTPTVEIPVTNNTAAAPAVSSVCPGDDPALVTGSTPVGNNYTYQWQQSSDNKTFTDIAGAVAKDYDPPVITATTYYRRSIISSVCDAPNISNVVTITLLKPATGNTIYAPGVASFCNAGDPALLRGSPPLATGKVYYQWQQSTDNINFTDISGGTTQEYDPPPVGVTTYYRRLITNSPCSIGIPSNIVTITVIPVPIPTVSAQQTVCSGDGVTLNATGGSRYSWSPAAGLSATDIASPIAKPTTTTTYAVTIFNGICNTTLSVKVIVVERPTVSAGADKEIMSGDRVQLTAQVSNAEGAIYSWTPATYLDNPNIANPVANPTSNITYRLTVTSAQSCFIVSDEVAINVRQKIIIPNTFTPNGDGIDDLLTIDGLDSYKRSTLTIFDRNGQQIFKSLAYPKPWDGTRNGKPIPMGTYYYVIELNNGQKPLSGYITLIK